MAIMKCANCDDTIYPDQPKKIIRSERMRGTRVAHKDHTGCTESLRRRKLENRKQQKA